MEEKDMNSERSIFSQIMDFVPMYEFRKCVSRYSGNYKTKSFSCWDQFLCMAFAQITYRESLRDIEVCLRASRNKLYHMGIRSGVSRNTLSNANRNRDWRIYEDFAHILINHARQLYRSDDFGIELEQTVYALDSTIIDLCLSLFPWASFRSRKSAIKLHTLMDLRGAIPTCVYITPGTVHDVTILDYLSFEAGSFYIFDRGYLDFERLYLLSQASAFFVTRAKSNMNFRRLYSSPVNKQIGVQCDQIIMLNNFYAKNNYPDKIRRIRYFDTEHNKRLYFLTNNFLLPALTIADLYRSRWKIELFFKWIKQNLRIKNFYGTSENAVKTQIWIAVSVYVLIAIIKKQLNLDLSLYTILQIFSVMPFEKINILQALTNFNYKILDSNNLNQLYLFD